VIKAAQVAGPGDVRDLERYHMDFHLLDARSQTPEKQELRGGTGETFDWALLAARRSKVPLILSGGLNAENVADAIAQTRPFAVDSASGTERAPGKKDEAKLRAFFAAVASSAPDHERAHDGAEALPVSLEIPEDADDGAEAIAVADAPNEGAAA
jgi:phosphoribosylanthranilate isomerase